MRSHQEIDFIVNHEKMPLRNPKQEIHAVVLQNGRWDNAITQISPLFIRGTQLVFDYQDQIIFPAGKEFRQLDLRSLRFRAPMIASMVYKDDYSQDNSTGKAIFDNLITLDNKKLELISNFAPMIASNVLPSIEAMLIVLPA